MEKTSSLASVPVADQPSADAEEPQTQISKQHATPQTNMDTQEDSQYVTGFKLAIIMVSLTMVFFLVMLDLSIIATVSQALLSRSLMAFTDSFRRLYLVLPPTSILCLMWDGTVAHISWLSEFSPSVRHVLKCAELNEATSCSIQPLTGKIYTHFNSKVTYVEQDGREVKLRCYSILSLPSLGFSN